MEKLYTLTEGELETFGDNLLVHGWTIALGYLATITTTQAPVVPSFCVGCAHCFKDECSDWQGTLPTDGCNDRLTFTHQQPSGVLSVDEAKESLWAEIAKQSTNQLHRAHYEWVLSAVVRTPFIASLLTLGHREESNHIADSWKIVPCTCTVSHDSVCRLHGCDICGKRNCGSDHS